VETAYDDLKNMTMCHIFTFSQKFVPYCSQAFYPRRDTVEKQMVFYRDGEIGLEASVARDTIWLTQKEIAILYGKDRTVITRHINNILKDAEVCQVSPRCSSFLTA
jgi:hypothetical protein